MKYLLDQGLPRSAVLELEGVGINSTHVGDLGLASASDLEILQYALENSYAVISLDSDFHEILAIRKLSMPTIIRMRIEGLKAPAIAGIMLKVIESAIEDIKRGSAISVTDKGIRIRHLPLV